MLGQERIGDCTLALDYQGYRLSARLTVNKVGLDQAALFRRNVAVYVRG